MKQHIIYTCEKCGKQSKEREEIMICEAAHLGLTIAEKQQWVLLKGKSRYKSAIVCRCKNKQTEEEFDDAIAELLNFEKKHGIER